MEKELVLPERDYDSHTWKEEDGLLYCLSGGYSGSRLYLAEEEETLLNFLLERKNAREPNQIDQLVKRRELSEMRRKAGYDDTPHCVSDMISSYCKHLKLPMIEWNISVVMKHELHFKRWFSDNYPPIL